MDGKTKAGDFDWISTSDCLTRELTDEDRERLEKQDCLNVFKRQKLEAEAQKNWDRFYNRNVDHFFKDRHWTKHDFAKILHDVDLSKSLVMLEAGCGVGNMLFPLMEHFPNWVFCGVDFSPRAIGMLNKRAAEMNASDLTASASDCIAGCSTDEFPKADVITMIFVLSSVSPEKQRNVIANVKRMLKKGGSVIVRDYGSYDHAMIRFGRQSKLSNRFYTRQDGTRAYFFEREELSHLFPAEEFEEKICEYLYKKTVNHKEELSIDRIFVQGRYVMK